MFENLIVKYTYSNFICLKIEINKLIRLNLLKFGRPWAGRDVVTAAQRVSLLFDLLHFMVTSSG